MMSANKNKIMNKCKSNQKNTKSTKLVKKLFCPPAMVRYDRDTTSSCKTMWVCRICLKCCLSDTIASEHSLNCRKEFNEKRLQTVQIQSYSKVYQCQSCNRSFSREVSLKSHLKVHDKVMSDTDSEIIIVKKKRRVTKKGKNARTCPPKNAVKIKQEKVEIKQEKVEIKQEKVEIKQEKINQEKIKQEKIKQEKINQEKIKQEKIKQEKIKQKKIKQEKINQEKINQEKIKQEKINQEKIKQEPTENVPSYLRKQVKVEQESIACPPKKRVKVKQEKM